MILSTTYIKYEFKCWLQFHMTTTTQMTRTIRVAFCTFRTYSTYVCMYIVTAISVNNSLLDLPPSVFLVSEATTYCSWYTVRQQHGKKWKFGWTKRNEPSSHSFCCRVCMEKIYAHLKKYIIWSLTTTSIKYL